MFTAGNLTRFKLTLLAIRPLRPELCSLQIAENVNLNSDPLDAWSSTLV